jgi:hypothetical protein
MVVSLDWASFEELRALLIFDRTTGHTGRFLGLALGKKK